MVSERDNPEWRRPQGSWQDRSLSDTSIFEPHEMTFTNVPANVIQTLQSVPYNERYNVPLGLDDKYTKKSQGIVINKHMTKMEHVLLTSVLTLVEVINASITYHRNVPLFVSLSCCCASLSKEYSKFG